MTPFAEHGEELADLAVIIHSRMKQKHLRILRYHVNLQMMTTLPNT
jgi:hypothetical protein